METWCFESIWIQHLTRCKNSHSEIDELWKCWLDDALVMKNLVQKLFAIPFLPLRFILWTKTQNCQFWRFFRSKKLQMLIFREQSFLQNLICKKKQIICEIWCVVDLLIQKLTFFAKFILNSTRIKFHDSKTDTLSKISIEYFFWIHFLWHPIFLRKQRKSNVDVFTVFSDIFLKTSSATGYDFIKTILLENVILCDIVESEPDTLRKSPFKNWRLPKKLIGRRSLGEKFGSKTVFYSSFFSQIHSL